MKKKKIISMVSLISIIFCLGINPYCKKVKAVEITEKNTKQSFLEIATKQVDEYMCSHKFNSSITPEEIKKELYKKINNNNIEIDIPEVYIVKDDLIEIYSYIIEKTGGLNDNEQNAAFNLAVDGRMNPKGTELSYKTYPIIKSFLGAYKFTSCYKKDEIISGLKSEVNDPNITILLNNIEYKDNNIYLKLSVKDSHGDEGTIYFSKYIAENSNIASNYNGWRQLANGVWNYYDQNNKKISNSWYGIDNKFYYFSADGTMVTGWYLINGDWYHFDKLGARNTGWLFDEGKWYYLSDTGKMLTNAIVEGRYILDSSGVWIR